MGAGINITISDNAVVTATGSNGGAGIGSGRDKSSGSGNITISGGSVKAEGSSYSSSTTAPAIGDGATYSKDGTAVLPTNGTDNLYLLEIINTDGAAITINGKAYPTAHGTEKKIYAYLPAKSADSPNTVKIGNTTTKYYYKTDDSTWYAVVDVPKADTTQFTYTGEEQTYNIPDSTLYTISGNKQTNAGTYTITVALNDSNSTWSDGTTAPKTYDFVIAKAKPTIPEPKLTYSELYYGKKELACEIQNGWKLPNDGNDTLMSIGANSIDVTLDVDGNNYDYTTGLQTGYTFDETHNTLTATITINVKKVKPEIKIDTDVKTAKSGDTITVTASAVNPYNNSMTPTVTTYVKVGDGAETELTGTTYTVPENLADKTKITFIARVEGSAEYEAASAETFVVIGDGSCTHDNANTGTWYSDDTYHWQICPDCGAQVNKGEHNSTGTKATCTTGAECSECGKTHGAIDRANHTLDCKKVDSEYHITYCKDCGYESSSKELHSFGSDNKCIYCGYKKNSSSDSGSGSSSGGSHSGGGYSGGSTATTSYPSINGTTMTWTAVNNALKTSENGSEATINLNGASTVPTSVLKTIAEKNLKVTFVYSDTKKWFVDGADIEDTAKISDWSVALTPESKLSTDGIRGVEGLKFTIAEPQFPTDLTLTFNQKYSGQFANIYKLVDEKLVFIGCRKIAEDGTVTLENIKGGTYAVTICEYSDLSGDMNNDGKLTAADATAALKYVVNLISDGNILMADLDGNGKITARDALIALRKVVGLD